jgi:hypothetical protein
MRPWPKPWPRRAGTTRTTWTNPVSRASGQTEPQHTTGGRPEHRREDSSSPREARSGRRCPRRRPRARQAGPPARTAEPDRGSQVGQSSTAATTVGEHARAARSPERLGLAVSPPVREWACARARPYSGRARRRRPSTRDFCLRAPTARPDAPCRGYGRRDRRYCRSAHRPELDAPRRTLGDPRERVRHRPPPPSGDRSFPPQ